MYTHTRAYTHVNTSGHIHMASFLVPTVYERAVRRLLLLLLLLLQLVQNVVSHLADLVCLPFLPMPVRRMPLGEDSGTESIDDCMWRSVRPAIPLQGLRRLLLGPWCTTTTISKRTQSVLCHRCRCLRHIVVQFGKRNYFVLSTIHH